MSIAFITGGTKGIGFATAEALASAGHTVIISGRDQAATDNAAAQICENTGNTVQAIALDVTNPLSVATAAQQIKETHGALDILVNNAGINIESPGGTPPFSSADVFRATFDTNVFGVLSVTEALLPLLYESDAGRIVNVSSTMGSLADQSTPDSPYAAAHVPAYRASKAALNSITIGLSKQVESSSIVVTSVCPGFVQTDLTPINKEYAPLTPAQAAETIVAAALLPKGAPSGTFVDAAGVVPW